jgi:excisionase family DNA binding protein
MQHESTASAPLANTIPQACQRLGVGRTAMYELMKVGAVRAFKVGSRTLIPESELQRFVAERMAKSEAA